MKITLFGVSGTGKSTISKMLAEEYNLEVHSAGDFFRAKAKEHGMTLNEYDELSKSDSKYDKETDQAVEDFGKTHDNFVVDGRLAWYFIPDSIKIKLYCEDEERYRRIAKRDDQSTEDAKKKTDHRDEAHRDRYFIHYGIEDFANDENYDLVVDTTNLQPDEAINEIREYLGEIKK